MDQIANDVMEKWICCQIGAREHYAMAVDRHAHDALEFLVTDYWDRKGFGLGNLSKNLKGRQQNALPSSKVISFNSSSIFFEATHKFIRTLGWDLVMKRNQWFQQKTVDSLKHRKLTATKVFSYSYAAKEIFEFAKSKGMKTVLGQIDPGPEEEKIVLEEVKRYPQYRSEWQPAPQKYWNDWFRECELADEIIVNSEWSRAALEKVGIDRTKIKIVPLTYQPPAHAQQFLRTYPDQFTKARPLRILFLGQVILRKGIARVIEAAVALQHEPVEFIVAGPVGITPLPWLPNVQWIGRVPRVEAEHYFQQADVFLFPTLSDGFGLTQLEAQAWKLPLIASAHCGTVVHDQINGWLLEDVESTTIEKVIREIIARPEQLTRFVSPLESSADRAGVHS